MNIIRKVFSMTLMSMLFFNCGINAISGWSEGWNSFKGIMTLMVALSPIVGGIAGVTAGIILGAQEGATWGATQPSGSTKGALVGGLTGAVIGLPVGILVPLSVGFVLVQFRQIKDKYDARIRKEESDRKHQEWLAQLEREREQNNLMSVKEKI